MKNKHTYIAITILILLFIGILFANPFYMKDYLFPKKFDSKEWKLAYESYKNNPSEISGYGALRVHKQMIYSLLRTQSLIGKTKEEVDSIIGVEGNKFEDNIWYYWLNFTAADDRLLSITFENNKVRETRIYEH